MTHHQAGRGAKAVHQQTGFLVDGQIVWPKNALHALVAKPCLRRLQKRLKGFGIIFSFDHSEKTLVFFILIKVKLIDLSADATHRLSVAKGGPGLKLSMLEIGIMG
jgi:hypothetical protein